MWLLIIPIIIGIIMALCSKDTWHERLLGFTGLYMVLGIWSPVLWCIESLMKKYHMGSFETSELLWLDLLGYLFIVLASVVAQVGFILLMSHISKLERENKEYLSYMKDQRETK